MGFRWASPFPRTGYALTRSEIITPPQALVDDPSGGGPEGPAAPAAKLWGMTEAWVYLLRCRDGSLYTGWTVDLDRRLARHRAGVASRYTASRLPVDLELAIAMPDRTAARREEARIKRLSRAAKLALLDAAR
jgi:putative endonuclease